MRPLLTILIWLLPLAAWALPCPKTLECPDGGKFQEKDARLWCTKGGEAHGPQIQCDRSGNLIEQDHYRNGTRHGRHVRYTPTGKLLIDETFVDGVVHGVSKSWHIHGEQLASEIEMDHGKPHGLMRRWHPNGVLAQEASYQNGEQHGRTQTWHPNGARQMIANYRNGKLEGERHQYHQNNWIYEIAYFEDGKPVGDYCQFSNDGKVEVRGQFEDSQKVGAWHYDFGRTAGSYDAGVKTGEWRYLDSDGRLARIENYQDGSFHGVFERYESGILIERGAYIQNLRDGVWESFEEEQLSGRHTWDEGMLLESCELRRKKLKCEKQTPYRAMAVPCTTKLDSSLFIDSPQDFAKHFECRAAVVIDWSRHHIYVHRDEADPYGLRLAGVEFDGKKHVLVFEQHRVCYGRDPGPPKARWIPIVLPRDIKELGQRIDRIPSDRDCSGVP